MRQASSYEETIASSSESPGSFLSCSAFSSWSSSNWRRLAPGDRDALVMLRMVASEAGAPALPSAVPW